MSKHKTYKKIKQSFSKERIEEIEKGADKIRKELNVLSTVCQVAGVTEEKLVELLEAGQPYVSHAEGGDSITLNTLIGLIVAMGGSIDITVNFPDKAPVQFSRVENLFTRQQ